jgi:phage terminase small subunit
MAAKKRAKPKVKHKAKTAKPRTSKFAARKAAFVKALILTNGNKRAAAVAAGYKPGRAADKAGERLSQNVAVRAEIAAAAEKAATIAGLSIERHTLEVARLAYADPRKLYRDGKLIPIEEWSDDAAAAVASIEVDEIYGEDDVDEELEPQPHGGALKRAHGKTKLIGHTKKLKLWDKNSALVTGARILGMFGKDNAQRGDAAVAALLAAVGGEGARLPIKP